MSKKIKSLSKLHIKYETEKHVPVSPEKRYQKCEKKQKKL